MLWEWGFLPSSGPGKAIAYLGPGAAVLMGVLTGIGGGIARDLLASEVPVVFTAELYAVAACGRAVVVFGNAVFPRSARIGAIGGIVCVALRLMALRRGWTLLVAQQPD